MCEFFEDRRWFGRGFRRRAWRCPGEDVTRKIEPNFRLRCTFFGSFGKATHALNDQSVGFEERRADFQIIECGKMSGRGLQLREREKIGFENTDAIQAPLCIDNGLRELLFERPGRGRFRQQVAGCFFVSFEIFRGEDDGGGGEAVPERIEAGAGFTSVRFRPGRVLSVVLVRESLGLSCHSKYPSGLMHSSRNADWGD